MANKSPARRRLDRWVFHPLQSVAMLLTYGTAYRAVKVPHEPADLERRLERMGWSIAVTPTSGPFYWGAGTAPFK